MKETQALNFLMKANKKDRDEAQNFIETLSDKSVEKSVMEYWEGRKFQAEMNIRLLQSYGISAS